MHNSLHRRLDRLGWVAVELLIATIVLVGADRTGRPSHAAAGAAPAAWTMSGDGKAMEGGASFIQEGKKPLVLKLQDVGADHFILSGQILLSDPKAASVTVALGQGADVKRQAQFRLNKDGVLQFGPSLIPSEKLNVSSAWLPFTLNVLGERATVQLLSPGIYCRKLEMPKDRRTIQITVNGAQVRNLSIRAFPSLPALIVPVTIESASNGSLTTTNVAQSFGAALDASSLPKGIQVIDGVPFCFSESAEPAALDVSKLSLPYKVPYYKKGVQPYPELAFEVPGDQYAAVHVIAFSTQRPGTTGRMAVRLGFVDGGGDIWRQEVVDVPALETAEAKNVVSSIPVKLANGQTGYLHHLRIPMSTAGQLSVYENLAVQFNRVVQTPTDRYLVEKVDPPCGAIVLAAAMERAGLEMRYASDEPGNVFNEPQKAILTVELTNRTDQPISGQLTARVDGPGTVQEFNANLRQRIVTSPFSVAPGQSAKVPLDLTPKARGWYACSISAEAGGQVLHRQETTMAYLAPDTRQAQGAESPFGIWCFWSAHTMVDDLQRNDKLASLMHKGGWRWTFGGNPAMDRGGAPRERRGQPTTQEATAVYRHIMDAYNVRFNAQSPPRGNPLAVKSGAAHKGPRYDKEQFENEVVPWLKEAPARGFDNGYLVLHESRINERMIARFGEMFGGPPFEPTAEEKSLLEAQITDALEFCRQIKKAEPSARIVLFNDLAAYAGLYLQRGFPADAFDVTGIEITGWLRVPEYPLDWISLLGGVHEIKRLQAKYGYDKPIWLTEALYHATKPGRLDLHQQAVIAVREAMIALGAGVERMAGCNVLADCSNSYSASGWGTAGMCFRDPEFNPKPSYAMYAWLTQVLDQAKYAGKLKHDSNVLHVLDFAKPDGSHLYPVWVVRGQQTVTLKVQDDKAVVYDCYGNALPDAARNGLLMVRATETPIYITGTLVSAVADRQPVEGVSEDGQLVLKFDSPDLVQYIDQPAPSLELSGINPQTKGSFRMSQVAENGASALKVELLAKDAAPQLIPEYGEFKLRTPLALPGRPYALNLRIKGNGGWGRILAEVEDGKGRRYSLSRGVASETLGRTCVDFDGWHTLQIPLPGSMEADAKVPWMANKEWAGAQTEAPIVYPLKLTKIIVAMPQSILYVDEERPVQDPSILIDSVRAVPAPAGM